MKIWWEAIQDRVSKLIFVLDINDYIFIVMFFLAALLITFLLFLVPYILIFQFKDEEKQTSYECGFQPFEDTRLKFDIKYYLVAILFIIFDIEILFILPWIKVFSYVYFFGTIWMFSFLIILTIGFIYEWNKGVLSWS